MLNDQPPTSSNRSWIIEPIIRWGHWVQEQISFIEPPALHPFGKRRGAFNEQDYGHQSDKPSGASSAAEQQSN
jgi:hypothetical protein